MATPKTDMSPSPAAFEASRKAFADDLSSLIAWVCANREPRSVEPKPLTNQDRTEIEAVVRRRNRMAAEHRLAGEVKMALLCEETVLQAREALRLGQAPLATTGPLPSRAEDYFGQHGQLAAVLWMDPTARPPVGIAKIRRALGRWAESGALAHAVDEATAQRVAGYLETRGKTLTEILTGFGWALQLVKAAPAASGAPRLARTGPLTEDCTSFRWGSQTFTFTQGRQAAIVKLMWNGRGSHPGGFTREEICELMVSDDEDSPGTFRLGDYFRLKGGKSPGKHAAWGTMIRRVTQGRYMIADPTDEPKVMPLPV